MSSTRRATGSSRGGASSALNAATPFSLRAMSTAAALLSRSRFATRHGVTFDGVRDYYQSLGYQRALQFRDYYERYERGGIAGRIIDLFPEAVWQEGIEIIEVEDPAITTQFESQIAALWNEHSITSVLQRAHILERIGHYSCILIGAREPDGITWEQPLSQLIGPDSILFLTPLSQEQCLISTPLVEDPGSKRWGMPEFYEINAGFGLGEIGLPRFVDVSLSRKVHHSRIIHVCQSPLGSQLYSSPALKRIWNWLDDLEFKLVGGGAEASWNRADPGFHADVRDAGAALGAAFISDEDLDASANQTTSNAAREEALEAEFSAYKHKLKRWMLTQGIDVEPFPSEKVDFASNVESLCKLIAGAIGEAQSIVFGNMLGLRASESDVKQHDRAIESNRSRFASPLVNELVQRFIDHGAVTRPGNGQYEILWPVEEESPEKEKAEVTEIWARANQAQFHCEGQIILTSAEIRDRQYGLEPLPEPVDAGADDGNADNDPAAITDDIINDNDLIQAAAMDRRVIIVGGPRHGKSSLARNFRTQGIPTYCGDPASMVKEPESGVVYLPENLEWSEGSQYIVDNWFTMPSPWCCEGVGMVRALRKLVQQGKKDSIAGAMILVKNRPVAGIEMTTGQKALSLGVQTVWNEIKDEFPHAINLDAPLANTKPAVIVSAAGKKIADKVDKEFVRLAGSKSNLSRENMRTHKQLRRQRVMFKVR